MYPWISKYKPRERIKLENLLGTMVWIRISLKSSLVDVQHFTESVDEELKIFAASPTTILVKRTTEGPPPGFHHIGTAGRTMCTWKHLCYSQVRYIIKTSFNTFTGKHLALGQKYIDLFPAHWVTKIKLILAAIF